MTDAAALHCSDCGAPVSPTEMRCDHCGASLQTLSCGECLALNLVGNKHCNRCGARLFAPRVQASPHACPRCRLALEVCAVGESIVEVCDRCGGLWVDADSFRRICERREKAAAFVGLGSPLPAPGGPVVPDTVQYVGCPDCGKLMNRVNFARHSGIVVDVCRSHGTWFDKDELTQILDFIAAGGIERAREIEREQLERENQRLHEKIADGATVSFQTDVRVVQAHDAVEATAELLGWLLK